MGRDAGSRFPAAESTFATGVTAQLAKLEEWDRNNARKAATQRQVARPRQALRQKPHYRICFLRDGARRPGPSHVCGC